VKLGPGRILGNHVVLDLGDGVYAALAHLRRGSVRVRPGDRVAAGLPVAFDHFQVAGADRAGLPGNLEAFTAGSLPVTTAGLSEPRCGGRSRRGTAGDSRGRRR
jgi:hypothetical protein